MNDLEIYTEALGHMAPAIMRTSVCLALPSFTITTDLLLEPGLYFFLSIVAISSTDAFNMLTSNAGFS